MGLGDKGAKQAGRGALFQKTENDAKAVSAEDGNEKKVRKQFEISVSLEERLRYYCYIEGIKIEASVLRDALDKYLPEVPTEMKRK